MYRWQPLPIPTRRDGRGLSLTLTKAAKEGRHVSLYYTPQRGWWGYQTTDETVPDEQPRLRQIMDASGTLRSVTTDVLTRLLDCVREGIPDEA